MAEKTTPNRCAWAKDAFDVFYHDNEWGKPEHDDQKLFEFLVLEGMQAGLSWNLILRRREAMGAALDSFDPQKVALYGEGKKAELMQNPGMIRNRRKVDAVVTNAQAFLQVQAEVGSFDAYLWAFVEGKPIRNAWKSVEEMPATSPLSDALAKDLKKRGFKFVGSTICYSYLQAAGLINDHVWNCAFV